MKKRKHKGKLLPIILIALLLLLACMRCDLSPITIPITPIETPTPTEPARSAIMKSREQLMLEYGLTPPPLPRTLLQPTLPPLRTKPPAIPTIPPKQTADIGGFFLTVVMALFALVSFSTPIPLY